MIYFISVCQPSLRRRSGFTLNEVEVFTLNEVEESIKKTPALGAGVTVSAIALCQLQSRKLARLILRRICCPH